MTPTTGRQSKSQKPAAAQAAPGYRRQARMAKAEEIAPPLQSSVRDFITEVIKVVAIALAIIIPVRFFLIQPFYVKGASMEPNFQDHEYLIIDEISYRFREPARGEVIVMHSPLKQKEFFIKRVIGLPGETVTISDNQVSVSSDQQPNGMVLDESGYLPVGTKTVGNIVATLSSDEYFVMGDNRAASLDSRVFGSIDRKTIIGRAWVRAWPLTNWTQFSAPHYSNP